MHNKHAIVGVFNNHCHELSTSNFCNNFAYDPLELSNSNFANRDGLVGKARTLYLTHLDLSPTASSLSLGGIHKRWFSSLNLSALTEG